jgi:hypothetical protein
VSGIGRAIILVHGIHTSKKEARAWMTPFAEVLKQTNPGVLVFPYTYGYVLGTSIAFPVRGRIVRRRAVRRFQKWAAQLVKRLGPDVELDAVGHSFGTHLVNESMVQDGGPRTFFRRVVYMGGIVSTRETFGRHDDHLDGVLNLYSREDEIVRLCPFGHCGWKGFKYHSVRTADGSFISIQHGIPVTQIDMTPLEHEDYTLPGSTAWGNAASWLAR